MPSPRQTRMNLPRLVAQAPLESMRSHLYPVDPPVQAYAEHAAGVVSETHFLPQRFALQHWKKDPDYGYPVDPMAGVHSYAAMLEQAGSTLQSVRAAVTPHPQAEWGAVARELVELIDATPGAPNPWVPYGRELPEPQRLPSAAFDTIAEYEHFAAFRHQERRRANRAAAMEQIRALDAHYRSFQR